MKAVALDDRFAPEIDLPPLLDRLVRRGGWLIFYAHDVDAFPSRWGCTPEVLDKTVRMVRARGVDVDEFAKAIPLGVTKVNIDTDGRLVWTRVHREYFRDHPEGFDFRKPGVIYVDAYADFIAHKNEKLCSAGQLPVVRERLGL